MLARANKASSEAGCRSSGAACLVACSVLLLRYGRDRHLFGHFGGPTRADAEKFLVPPPFPQILCDSPGSVPIRNAFQLASWTTPRRSRLG